MRLWRSAGGLFCLLLIGLACSHLKQVMRHQAARTVHAMIVVDNQCESLYAEIACHLQATKIQQNGTSQTDNLQGEGKPSIGMEAGCLCRHLRATNKNG